MASEIFAKFYILPLQSQPQPIRSQPHGPIAQLDRVLDYESRGRGFESSSVRHFQKIKIGDCKRRLLITLSF
jgi:hypothetical protein